MYKEEHFTDSIYYKLEQTAKYCRYLGIQLFQKFNIPMSVEEFAAMDVITANDGICQRELAKIILKDRANTGRILKSLENKGYIERMADTKNNRLVRKMKPTPEGIKCTFETSEKLREHISKIPKVFSEDDKKNLMELLKKFRIYLEKEVEMKI